MNRPYDRNNRRTRGITVTQIIMVLVTGSVCGLTALMLSILASNVHLQSPTATPVANIMSNPEFPPATTPVPLALSSQPAPTGQPSSLPSPSELPTQTTPTQTLPPQENLDVDSILSQMSLEQKVGQMILAGMNGQTVNSESQMLVQKYNVGGFVYFASNINTREQVRQLSSDLQALAAGNSPAVPLLIAVDHEGGLVHRFNDQLTHFPSFLALGAGKSPEQTYQVAAAAAKELRWVGVNVSLGPDLDVLSEPANSVISLRSFGGKPNLVSKLGESYLAGLQENQVIGA